MTDEMLFGCACCGDVEALEKHYKSGGSLNVTCKSLGHENSLIMGAFRNRQWDTVEFLMKWGAKPTEEEKEKINNRFLEMYYLGKLQTVVIQ